MLKIPNRTLTSAPSLVCAVHKTAHPPPALILKICSLIQCMAQTECWSTIFLFLTPHILIPHVSKSSWPLIQNIFWIYSSNIYILLYGTDIIHIYIIYTYIYTAYLTRSPQSPVRTVLVLPIWPPCFPLAAFSTQPSEDSFKTWTRLFHSDLKSSHGFTSTENKIQIPFYGQGALRDLAPVGLSDFIFSLSLIFCKDVKLTPTSGLWDFLFSALPDISPYFHVSGVFLITQDLLQRHFFREDFPAHFSKEQGYWAPVTWERLNAEGEGLRGLEHTGFQKEKVWVRWKLPCHHWYRQFCGTQHPSLYLGWSPHCPSRTPSLFPILAKPSHQRTPFCIRLWQPTNFPIPTKSPYVNISPRKHTRNGNNFLSYSTFMKRQANQPWSGHLSDSTSCLTTAVTPDTQLILLTIEENEQMRDVPCYLSCFPCWTVEERMAGQSDVSIAWAMTFCPALRVKTESVGYLSSQE